MIICTKCHRQMRPKKNGVDVIEQANNKGVYWGYKLWEADLWECQDCGITVLYVGDQNGQQPIAEHYQPEFEQRCAGVEHRAKEWSRG